ncbi:hypothetical protein X801_02316 [Opisthorchis viverrini]|uniref:Uncharacterized protein n=1 Tax=Opisthorchis viverrini TaxID=6198 RepID=A0A1S8X547_OPIVI|nr:hypothetical protein X801_02316 [Opisthorchis viverrini]
MRTRNRGKRISFVSALGLGPRRAGERKPTRYGEVKGKPPVHARLTANIDAHEPLQTTQPGQVGPCRRGRPYKRRFSRNPSGRTGKVSLPRVTRVGFRDRSSTEVFDATFLKGTLLHMRSPSSVSTTCKTPGESDRGKLRQRGRKRHYSYTKKSTPTSSKENFRTQTNKAEDEKISTTSNIPLVLKRSSRSKRGYSRRTLGTARFGESHSQLSCTETDVPFVLPEKSDPETCMSEVSPPHDPRLITGSIMCSPSNLTGVKRRRGRPPSVSKFRNQPTDKMKYQLTTFTSVSDLPVTGVHSTVCYSRTKTYQLGPKSVVDTPCMPSQLPASFLFNESGQVRYGASDEVLQDILREVNANGHVPRVIWPTDRAQVKLTDKQSHFVDGPYSDIFFDLPVVQTVFEEIWNTCDNFVGLQTKDLFLAINGLLRPGVCELWRRKREDQTKKLSRSIMGRLRPNPRPRRYSDMIISNSSALSASSSTRQALETTAFVEKARQGSRSVVLANARLTAAKRLMRARSKPSASSSIVARELKRSVSDRISDSLLVQGTLPRRIRPSRQSGKAIPPVCQATRERRRPDVSHHIHWKFCYPSMGKENAAEIPLITSNSNRKRKVRTHTSPQLEGRDTPDDSTDFVLMQENMVTVSEPECSESVVLERTPMKDDPKAADSIPEEVKPEKPPSLLQNDQPLLLLERSGIGRRKRRHALTVQRKRPVDRFLPGSKDHERECWRIERTIPTHLEDVSSNSSSTSASGLADAYGRIFRPSKWYQKRTSKTVHSRRIPSRRLAGVVPMNQQKYLRSISAVKSRQSVNSPNMPRRLAVVKHEGRSMSPRQKISRRPDRMCQLTLLDRLVLGLNCSVSQTDKEIYIKQLNADELDILTQRMDKTGFFVQSLSVRRNSNNDAEYNLVLTFSPSAEPVIRRPRSLASSNRHRYVSFDHSADASLKCHSERILSKRLSNRPTTKLERSLSGIYTHFKSTSSGSGYLSDSAITLKRHDIQLSSLRQVHSDGEDASPCSILVTNEDRVIVDGKLAASILGSDYVHTASSSKFQGRHDQWPHETYSPHVSPNWAHSLSYKRSNNAQSERHSLTLDVTPAHKRTALTKGDYPTTDATVPDTHASVVSSSSSTNVSTSHVVSKRSGKMCMTNFQSVSTFRRPSPRKVIRKVYTGSSTIPKILNRRRPPGTPPVTLPISTSVTPSTTGVISCNMNQSTSASQSNINTSTLPSTNVIQCVNKAIAPTVLFEEPNPPLTMYAQATPTLPTQYRRLQTSATPVSVVSTSLHHSEQVPASVTHGSAISPIQSDLGVVVNTVRFPGTPPPSGIVSVAARMQGGPKPCPAFETNELAPSDSAFEGDSSSLELTSPNTRSINDVPSMPFTVETHPEQTPPVKSTESSRAETIIHFQINAPEPSEQRSVSPTIPGEADTQADLDDSRTPATALSASQLLKLKRLHDGSGRPALSPTEARPTQMLSQSPSRVQSPQSLTSRSQSQAQPINTEPTTIQSRQSVQLMPNQEFSSSSSHSTTGSVRFNPGFYPVSATVGETNRHDAPSLISCDDEETDDFELKTVGNKVFCEVSSDPAFTSRIPSSSSDGNLSTTVYRPTVEIPYLCGNPPVLNPIRTYKPAWSHVRPFFSTSGHTSSLASPLTTSGLTVLRGLPTVARPAFDSCTPNQVATRVVVQEPTIMSRFGEVAAAICEAGRTPSPLSSGATAISTFSSSATSLSQTFSVSDLSNSTGLPIVGCPNKRTVVHKYHSFRKILPKSPEPSGLLCPPTAPNSTFVNVTPISLHSPCLTQLPVVTSVYRNALTPQPTAIPCDASNQAAYFLDVSSNVSVGRMKSAECGPSGFGVAPNPASQLLKSLLESSDSKEQGTTQTVPTSSTASVSSTTQVTSSASMVWNQPAHQSRGTWQLGKRATCTPTQRGSSDTANLAAPRSSITSSISRSLSATSISSTETRSSPSLLPPTVIRTSGPTSRLQQMQQYHQRRQQLLAQRQAQKHIEQESAVRGD